MEEYIISFDPAVVNMAYCVINIETLKIKSWDKFSIKDSTNEGSCSKLAGHLDRLKLTDGIKSIILHEQQPRCNVKTINICGQLQMYYVLEKLDNPGIKKIVGYHAGNKIKYYIPQEGDEPMPTERLAKLKVKHYRTKQTLIEHCRRILKHNQETEWLEWFEKQKKLDDLADSYVMSLSYLKTHNLGFFKNS
jgi:hypothetical protein